MVEKARRVAVTESRPDADPAWEVFARDETDDPLRYAGTVRAEDADEAHERATRLFCWYADEVWVCPTAEMTRYAVEAADEAADSGERELAVPEFGDEERTHEL